MKEVAFSATGTPRPQGSQEHRAVRRADGRMVSVAHEKPTVYAWRRGVASAALFYRQRPLWAGPVELDLTFILPRPKSKKSQRPLPTKPPDLDKLQRAVMDALAGVIYENDSQVVSVRAEKRYGAVPGVDVRARQLGE